MITLPLQAFYKAWQLISLIFTHFYLATSNLLPNFLMTVTHSFFKIMSSLIPWDQNGGSEETDDLAPFNGSLSCLLNNRFSWWPCINNILYLSRFIIFCLVYNIRERHLFIQKFIGTKEEEDISMVNGLIVLMSASTCLLVSSILEVIFYFMYNRKVS